MSARPSGTITFLFTDIEGSTRLWEEHPEAMKPALARHDAILREQIEKHDGAVFKTVGDAFCAAFADAGDAIRAALGSQRALQAEAWPPEIGVLRARAALHTGATEERDDDYFGPPVNRVARLLSAGHGGQTLLSAATMELVRDSLPEDASVTGLGEHRLKDLFRAERIYQLAAADLPASFPPLKSLDASLTNLPVQPTPFIGRSREQTAVLALLRNPEVRLATLTGPGGTGKTRLALQVAADLLDEHEHGVWFVGLATVTEAERVVPEIASALGVKSYGERRVAELLKSYLREKRLLLVLDNLEQVVAAGPAIAELLATAPGVKILVTSRERLRIYGEHEYLVPTLALPRSAETQTVSVLSQYEAVALFIQRSKAAKADWEITDANAPAVAEICVRLDGLPLAIELAAARSRMFAPDAMLSRLGKSLEALTGGARDLPARQQTIRNTIDWSYALLGEGERVLFARLAVFVGGWTLEAAEAVCGAASLPPLPGDVAETLESLLDKSMVRRTEGTDGGERFTMLETVLEYASERLEAGGETHALHRAHAEYFRDQVRGLERTFVGPSIDQLTGRAGREYTNLLGAIEWCLLQRKAEVAADIALSLTMQWLERMKPISDGLKLLARIAALGGDLPERKQAAVLDCLGGLRSETLALDPDAVAASQTVLLLARLARDADAIAGAAANLAIFSMHERPDLARSYVSEALEAGAAVGQPNFCRLMLAAADAEEGLLDRACTTAEQERIRTQATGEKSRLAGVLLLLAQIAIRQGRIGDAATMVAEAIPLGEARRGVREECTWRAVLGGALAATGDHARAREELAKAAATAGEYGLPYVQLCNLVHLVDLAVRCDRLPVAARLIGALEALFGMPARPLEPWFVLNRKWIVASGRAAVGEDLLSREAPLGRAMTLDQAVTYGLEQTVP